MGRPAKLPNRYGVTFCLFTFDYTIRHTFTRPLPALSREPRECTCAVSPMYHADCLQTPDVPPSNNYRRLNVSAYIDSLTILLVTDCTDFSLSNIMYITPRLSAARINGIVFLQQPVIQFCVSFSSSKSIQNCHSNGIKLKILEEDFELVHATRIEILVNDNAKRG